MCSLVYYDRFDSGIYQYMDERESINIEDCFKKYSEEEIIEGEYMLHCSQCKEKTKSNKRISIWEPPEILIIQFNRFNNEIINNRFQGITKNYTNVEFPITELDIKSLQLDIHLTENKYELISLCEHRGSISGGHYVSYCKNSINNKWYEHNDEDVIHVPDENLEKELITNNAYILFYEKKYNMFDDDSDSSSLSSQEEDI